MAARRSGWQRPLYGDDEDQSNTPRSELRSQSFETQEVPLPPLLTEFRTALREETEAARKSASSSALPLSNGRRIGQVGGSFQYVFAIDNVLNAPNDSPGELIVPGAGRVDATIISVEGLTVTLGVPQNLGEFVPYARLQSDLSFLLRKLIERLETWGNRENPAGARLLGDQGASGNPATLSVADATLNDEQRQAVASAVGRNTTFIWGPPGTGKTTTIGCLGGELLRAKRSLLLVSHTNIALDQALLRIADSRVRDIEDGTIVRVGEPRDKRLLKRPELLLKTQVQKKAAELTKEKDELNDERETKSREVVRLQDMLALLEWVTEAAADIRALQSSLLQLHQLKQEAEQASVSLPDVEEEITRWEDARAKAAKTAELQQELEAAESKLASIRAELRSNEATLLQLRGRLTQAGALLEQAQGLEPKRVRLQQLGPVLEFRADMEAAQNAAEEWRLRHERAQAALGEARLLLDRTSAAGTLTRLWKRLPKPEEQKLIVGKLDESRTQCRTALDAAETRALEAKAAWSEASALSDELKPFLEVPRASTQLQTVEQLRCEGARLQQRNDQLSTEASSTSLLIEELAFQVKRFDTQYRTTPEAIIADAEQRIRDLRTRVTIAQDRVNTAANARTTLEERSRRHLTVLEQCGMASGDARDADTMVHIISATYERAKNETASYKPNEIHAEIDTLNERIRQIGDLIRAIDEALKQVEEIVIAGATVVATTLTAAYLRDSIQKRRFDTVLLDEASVAPIPALWIAASLADSNVVVVGDFRQLPPIVQSDHELARKWLGRDVFGVSGIKRAYEDGTPPPHFAALNVQYRMEPSICDIPSTLYYDGKLVSEYLSEERDKLLYSWYTRPWGKDSPLSVVDTGALNAWVTSVTRGGSTSRLNFLSAVVCVDLAEQVLKPDRLSAEPGDPARVLIVCPYSPHAKLLKLLLSEHGLEAEVTAGTVHSFQGSEADVVFLDLVNDEPHWRVAMCNPENDEVTRRLFNVALTRARSRLIVVGDLKYVEGISRNAFLGQRLIPLLRTKAAHFDAVQVTQTGLAARAAASQLALLGGEVEAPHERIVVTQQDFYRYLFLDLERAKESVVIYSPFLTEARVGILEPALRACMERGVRVYVITKTIGERSTSQQGSARHIEKALRDWGVVIIHKRNMHEKLVFIDDHTLWSGSLNPLSYTDTQEVMERRFSPKVVSDYAETLKLQDLVRAFDGGETDCPICGGEIIASEGRKEPFYWRCIEDGCFSRSIGQPMPTDGRITCANCGAPVEFGEWGKRLAWRCTANPRHRQPIVRSHLKLPKMLELVPRKELKKLHKSLGIIS